MPALFYLVIVNFARFSFFINIFPTKKIQFNNINSKIFLYNVAATIVKSLLGFSNENTPDPNDKMMRVPQLYSCLLSP